MSLQRKSASDNKKIYLCNIELRGEYRKSAMMSKFQISKLLLFFLFCFSFSKILVTRKSNNLLSSGDEKFSSAKNDLFE